MPLTERQRRIHCARLRIALATEAREPTPELVDVLGQAPQRMVQKVEADREAALAKRMKAVEHG